MITRIVRMHFREEAVDTFLAIFTESKSTIASFEGCHSLALHRDASNPSVYYTLSRWESEGHLNKYRHSLFFKETWGKTKVLFSEKPMAFSLQEMDIVD